MSYDKTITGDQDRARIDALDAADVHDWAKKLDVTAEQIKEAVQVVGDQADQVELHLKGTRSTTNADITKLAEQLKANDASQDTAKSEKNKTNEDANKIGNEASLVMAKLKDLISTFSASAGETFQTKSKFAQDKTREATDFVIEYAKAEPAKAMLIAAATGALLAGIVVTITRPRD